MIKCVNISKKYTKYVIRNFSYNFKDKGLYLLVGKSGVGKTTLLNIISGNDTDFKGSLGIDSNVFYLRDKSCLVSSLTVRENIKIFEQANDKALDYYFSIDKYFDKKVKNLSLGELQLLIINLALNSREKIIILDEPLSALSIDNARKVSEYLSALAKERLVIIATHNWSFFKEYELIELKQFIKDTSLKEFTSYYKKERYEFKKFYRILYVKKTLLKRIIFLFSFISTIINFFFVSSYLNGFFGDFLDSFKEREGVVISKENDIKELNEINFYEVVKKLSIYIEDYNVNYYNDLLYDYEISVNEYYIDNGFNLSSVSYIENGMENNELVIGMNYQNFCKYNNVYNCDENYLKSLVIGRPLNDFAFYIKDIFESEETVILSNKRFFKIYEDNDYEEYYFDVLKANKASLFEIINNNEFLLSFGYTRIGESEDRIRYRVEIKQNKNFKSDIDYDRYIVCMEKGYNCLDYFNHFNTLISINEFTKISELDFKIFDGDIEEEEIVISSGLGKKLNKEAGDIINLFFECNGLIKEVSLKIRGVVDNSQYYLYHNSGWTYEFFKNIVGLDSEDLQIKNLIIYEEINEEDYKETDYYSYLIGELKSTFLQIKKFIFTLNVVLSFINVFVLIVLEIFNNKFKKEYYDYLDILNIEKFTIKKHS